MKTMVRLGNRMLLTLVTSSSLLFIVTALTTPRIDSSSDMFLYAKSLPITYWLGLALSVLILVWRGKSSKFVVVGSTILIACYLFALPSIVYVSYPGSSDAYGHMSRALYISKIGRIESSGVESFPGSYIFTAVLHLVTGIKPLSILKAHNPAYIFFIALIAYLMTRRLNGGKCAYVAPLAILGLYWSSMYFGKSTYGYMLWSILWLILLILTKHRDARTAILTVLVYGALTISHPLSSLLAPLGILPYTMSSRLLKERTKPGLSLIMLFAVMWCLWHIVNGFFIMPIIDALRYIYELLISESREPLYSLTRYTAAYSAEYLKVICLRIFSSLFEVTIGTVLSIITLFRRRDRSSLLLAIGFLVYTGLFISPFSRTSLANLNRAVEHNLVLYAPLISTIIGLRETSNDKPTRFSKNAIAYVMLSLLIVLVFLTPITAFTSSMPFMHIPTVSHEGSNFLLSHYNPDPHIRLNRPYIAIQYYAFLIDNVSSEDWYWLDEVHAKDLFALYPESINEVINYQIVVVAPLYFVLDEFRAYDPSFRDFTISIIQFLNSNSQFNKIYTNSPHFMIWARKC